MNVKFYKLKCITNLFVGNGDNSYGIIDNQVEKDPILETPIIPSSGLKGSFREFFENKKLDEKQIIKFFGNRPTEKEENNLKDGKLHFFTAQLLFRPMRVSLGNSSYCLVTTVDLLCRLFEMLEELDFYKEKSIEISKWRKNINNIQKKLFSLPEENGISNKGIYVEGYEVKKDEVVEEFIKFLEEIGFLQKGKIPIVILKSECFKEVDLPIVARNRLDNGVSKSLWYEEIVPHQSVFYFAVMYPNELEKEYKIFYKSIVSEAVRFGGGASIGYGYCSICEIKNGEQQGSDLIVK